VNVSGRKCKKAKNAGDQNQYTYSCLKNPLWVCDDCIIVYNSGDLQWIPCTAKHPGGHAPSKPQKRRQDYLSYQEKGWTGRLEQKISEEVTTNGITM